MLISYTITFVSFLILFTVLAFAAFFTGCLLYKHFEKPMSIEELEKLYYPEKDLDGD